MEIIKAIPLLEQYPNWIRIILAIWLFVGGVLPALLFYFHPSSTVDKKDSKENILPSSKSNVTSHLGAIDSNMVILNCKRYRADVHLNVYTLERRICETLHELRNNMLILKEIKSKRDEYFKNLSIGLKIKFIKSYINQDLTEITDGPKKKKLSKLISNAESSIMELKSLDSEVEFKKWSINSPQTLDDLFIIFGFLEWVVGYDIQDKISPSELSHFHPFFDVPFTRAEKESAVVKEFLSDDGLIASEYSTILGNYD